MSFNFMATVTVHSDFRAQKNKVKPNITTDWLIMTYQRSFTNCNILVCDVDGGSSYVGEGRRYTDGHSVFSV